MTKTDTTPTGRVRKSWKQEYLILKRKFDELTENNSLSQKDEPPKAVATTQPPETPKLLTEKPKKVEPQAPQEQKNTLEIEEAEEIKEKIKDKPKEEVEEFDYECPECSFKFNELNNDCCPNCNTELE